MTKDVERELKALLEAAGLPTDNRVGAVNVTLLKRGEETILVVGEAGFETIDAKAVKPEPRPALPDWAKRPARVNIDSRSMVSRNPRGGTAAAMVGVSHRSWAWWKRPTSRLTCSTAI